MNVLLDMETQDPDDLFALAFFGNEIMSRSKNGRIYDGCLALHPNGQPMFRCDLKRANWYLKRHLATVVDSDPLTIQLTFQPKGPGNVDDEFYLQALKNICVVCGSRDNLSRHHVVPHCYVKEMSDYFRHNSHDVLPMCVDCHKLYEQEHSASLRQVLADEYDAPVNGNGEFHIPRPAAKSAYVLLNYADQLPDYRQQELLTQITNELGREPTKSDLLQLASEPRLIHKNDKFKTHGKLVMSQIEDVDAFVRRWRNHFIETMKPKYLPDLWDVDREVSKGVKL